MLIKSTSSAELRGIANTLKEETGSPGDGEQLANSTPFSGS